MNIIIVGSINSFSSYEEEQLVNNMTKELKEMGHVVDNFLLPYKPQALTILDQIFAYNLLDVSAAELLITIGYPACTISHPNKICYLLEAAPMLHEYWDTEYGILGNHQYSRILVTLNNIENNCLSEAKVVFCDSRVLCEDLNKRCGINTEYLPLPLLEPKEIYKSNELKDEYYVVETCLLQNSRYYEFLEKINGNSKIKILMFIPNADIAYINSLEKLIQSLNIIDNVEICYGQPSDNVLKKSLGYIHFCKDSRRFDNIINRCVALSVPVFAVDDCGAALDVLSEYDVKKIISFDRLADSLKLNVKIGEEDNSIIINIRNFAERIMNICV